VVRASAQRWSPEVPFADTLSRVKIVGTNSHLLARAYGVASPTAPARTSTPSIETRASRISDSATLGSIRTPDVAARVSQAAPGVNLERLVAATVPGRVDFDSPSVSLSAPGNYTMHGRPADRNAAAVAVQTGRALDLQA
jgi:hypothetical protein